MLTLTLTLTLTTWRTAASAMLRAITRRPGSHHLVVHHRLGLGVGVGVGSHHLERWEAYGER